jgi:hypothetical protein
MSRFLCAGDVPSASRSRSAGDARPEPPARAWLRGYTPVIGLRLHLACGVLSVAVTLAVVVTLATSALLLVSGLALTPVGEAVAASHVTGAAGVEVWRPVHR